MVKNGVLIQSSKSAGPHFKYIRISPYDGIHAHQDNPLEGYKVPGTNVLDQKCKDLSEELWSRKFSDGYYMLMNFCSSHDFMNKYIKACKEREIQCRILFVESDYEDEIWDGGDCDRVFIGYEVCQLPIDAVATLDLGYYEEFNEFSENLNEHGLFKTYDQAEKYRKEYTAFLKSRDFDYCDEEFYVFKLYELIL